MNQLPIRSQEISIGLIHENGLFIWRHGSCVEQWNCRQTVIQYKCTVYMHEPYPKGRGARIKNCIIISWFQCVFFKIMLFYQNPEKEEEEVSLLTCGRLFVYVILKIILKILIVFQNTLGSSEASFKVKFYLDNPSIKTKKQ